MEFSNAKMKEIIKQQTGKRVSKNAGQELGEVIETFAGDVAEEAIALAENDGRKTLKARDVRQALR